MSETENHKADLRCIACGKYLGDNNDIITSGPHAGARPTDLVVFCEVTGKMEGVVDGRHHLDALLAESEALSSLIAMPETERRLKGLEENPTMTAVLMAIKNDPDRST